LGQADLAMMTQLVLSVHQVHFLGHAGLLKHDFAVEPSGRCSQVLWQTGNMSDWRERRSALLFLERKIKEMRGRGSSMVQ